MDAHANFAYGVVGTAPSPATSGTSIGVTGGTWPAAPFNATVHAAAATEAQITSGGEIVRVTALSGGTPSTITRASEGPNAARSIVVGDVIKAGVTAKTLTDIEGSLVTVFDPRISPGSGDFAIYPLANGGPPANVNLVNQKIWFYPMVVTIPRTVTAISAKTLTAASAGATLRFGIYNDSGARPSTVMLDAGTIAATAGFSDITKSGLSAALTPGRYWIAMVQQGAPSPNNCLVASYPGDRIQSGFVSAPSINAYFNNGIYLGYTMTGIGSGALPTASGLTALLANNSSVQHPCIAVTFT